MLRLPFLSQLEVMHFLWTVIHQHVSNLIGAFSRPIVRAVSAENHLALIGSFKDEVVVFFSARIIDRSDFILLGLDECVDIGDDETAEVEPLTAPLEPLGRVVELPVIGGRSIVGRGGVER